MKKFLLSLLCLVGFVVAYATDVSITFSDKGYANEEEVSSVTVDDYITIYFDKGTNSNSPKYYNTGTAIRVYGGGTMTIQGANSAITINSVTINCTTSNPIKPESTVSSGTLTIEGATGTISNINTDQVKFTQGGTMGHVRIQSVNISYTIGEVTQVSTPTISPEEGEITAETEISISCATEGASIYYTIDGTDPTAESILYEAPFTLAAEATVKAIAVKDGLENSSIASAKFTFPCANIAEFISDANNHATTITGPVTVVAQSGKYLFIQDNSGKMIAFGSLDNTYNNGDQLSNIKGTYTLYNGLPEMNVDKSSFGTATAGTAVEPTILTVEELAIDNLLTYIKLEDVTISKVSGKNATITDETGSIALYNTLAIDLVEGENLTVVGFISCYNTTLQVMPLEITSASGLKIVEAPVINPNGGSISKDQTIEITCATEGASIYYTVDGNDPTAESTLYEAPFTLSEECIVKAIAIAEGMENSTITEAAFTFLSDDTKVVTYNFTDPSSLTPAQEEPEFGKSIGVAVNDVNFTAEDVTLVCAKGEAGTDCRIWAGTSAYDLRTYKNSTITLSVTNGTFTSITFDGSKIGDEYISTDSGNLTNKVWTADANTSSVEFTATMTTNINTITVTYVLNGNVNAIEDVEVESNEAVEYYNLQGVKVDNPENGLYIRKQGSKATKVLVK